MTFAGTESGFESGLDALADEGFVAVVAGAVEVAVAEFDGGVDDGGGEVVGNFPGAEAGVGEVHGPSTCSGRYCIRSTF